ncbi:hypothetical protein MPSEU_000463300 [Mayamaea pseudoterrestris]|nr:hypothetical protein MPSEU_000463300 [Mayamaea pseudoterrestris]
MSKAAKYALIVCIIACAMLLLEKQLSLQRSLVTLLWPITITSHDASAAPKTQQSLSSGTYNLLVEPPLRLNVTYTPSSSEAYVNDHAGELGLLADNLANLTMASCRIFTDAELPVYNNLQAYRTELADYTRRVDAFSTNVKDLRRPLQAGANRNDLCATLDLNLTDIFKESNQLSHGSFGYAEPLIPPLRHPEFCFDRQQLMTMTYMVHDWTTMCHRLTPFSRTVFIDMGASLAFHSSKVTPAIYILDIYKKFGFKFDHVYAFEITPQAPAKVFEMVPSTLLSQYHWLNVGVESDPQGKMNPLRMLLEEFTEDDFVVIKLDIDTSWIELPLAYQLLNDERYNKLVDQLYFEHHVFQKELVSDWKTTMRGSIKSSFDLFGGLRRKGIAAHYWV